MTTKKAYQFDNAGFFSGETDADESPLEAGVYLLPARSTFKKPPEEQPGKVARWAGSKWQLVNIPTPDPASQDAAAIARAKLRDFLDANPDVVDVINQGGV